MPQCVVIMGKPVMTGHYRVRRSLSFKIGNALSSTADFKHEKIWTNSVTIANDYQRCEARQRSAVNSIDITACSPDRMDSSLAISKSCQVTGMRFFFLPTSSLYHV